MDECNSMLRQQFQTLQNGRELPKQVEKEKLLITSNFSFSHSVFKGVIVWEWVNLGFFVDPFSKQSLVFTFLQYKSFENSVGKGENARNEQFLLFPQCFQKT